MNTHPNNTDQLVAAIVKVLDKGADEANKNSYNAPGWINVFKKELINLGRNAPYDYKIATAGFKDEACDPEWLYDMVWYKETGNGKNTYTTDIDLVMECEWSISIIDIRYDFEKLLLANVPLKLFICNMWPERLQEINEYFENAAKRCRNHDPGFLILIALLDLDTDKFMYFTIHNGLFGPL